MPKICNAEDRREWFHRDPAKTKDRTKLAYEKNKEKLKEKLRVFRLTNPPKRGGSPRVLSDEERQVRKKIYRRRTYEKNKEKVLAVAAAYRQAHLAEERINRRAHYEKNKERNAQITKAYRLANLELYRNAAAKRRASKRKAIPKWANLTKIAEIYASADWMTANSGEKWHVDHIVPLQHPRVCGLHCEANLNILPEFENLSKGNRHWPDMFDT